MNPRILDPCCGSRMFWFDKKNPEVIFGDNRDLDDILCDGRKLEIKPDVLMDFRKIPYIDNFFNLIVFDPPHMNSLGKNSWMAKKYGVLGDTWRDDLRAGFKECFRVLADNGVLIFKWNESDIKVKEVLDLVNYKPFCEERPTFCYCEMGSCEFKLQWDTVSGLSKDTKQLCNLAKKISDKEMIFKAGCN